MPGEEFGYGMDDYVGAVVERAVSAWGGEGVVDHQKRADLFRQSRDPFHISNADGRVGDHFDNDHLGVRLYRCAHGSDVGWIGERRLNPKARQIFSHQTECSTIELFTSKNVVAALQAAHENRTDG